MSRIFLNNVKTKLTAVLAAAGTSCSVTAGDGALFADATGGDTIRATLVKVSGFKEIDWEIVDITARSTDTLTITRAQEGTIALDFAIGDVLDVRWTANSIADVTSVANENYVINGNFDIWQRGTAAVTTSGAFSADRFKHLVSGDTFSATQGTFASGDALYDPTTGNTAAANYIAVAVTTVAGAGNYTTVTHPIEDVRRLANKTITVSFWAKAASGTPSIGLEITQVFGTGGAPSATVTGTGQAQALSTTWTKYTKTFTVPSINGKTLGTDANSSYSILIFWLDAGSTFDTRSGSIGQASKTVSIAQVKVEEGSVATQFVPRPLQQELALCQRYYFRDKSDAVNYFFALGWTGGTTIMYVPKTFPVPMRVKPTALEQSGTATDYEVYTAASGTVACSAVPTFNTATPYGAQVVFTVAAGLTSGQSGTGRAATSAGYLGWSAEL